jgi:hypothetical protein
MIERMDRVSTYGLTVELTMANGRMVNNTALASTLYSITILKNSKSRKDNGSTVRGKNGEKKSQTWRLARISDPTKTSQIRNRLSSSTFKQ